MMDERHWWFASRLQETFRFSGYDNPSVLEDFLSDFEVAELITNFLSPGEPRKLFFYCEVIPEDDSRPSSALNRCLRVTEKITSDFLASLEGLQQNNGVCLYVLKKNPDCEIDISAIDKELYCGEIRQSVLTSLSILLTNAYSPLLHNQADWGSCSKENVAAFLSSFDKLTNVIHEMSTVSLAHEPSLRQPSSGLKMALLHPPIIATTGAAGKSNLSSEVIAQCEILLTDWIEFIEGVIIEVTDERLENSLGVPVDERQKWERRQVQLQSIIEQLKWRESTSVIATLAAVKSKLIKKWRVTDVQLTEAFNSCKDKVWYLTMLQPHFDAIQQSLSPSMITNTILPSLTTTIKQMEGLSRLFARTNYIAVLLKKIANLIAIKCQQLILSKSDDIWSLIFDESNAAQLDGLLLLLQDVTQLNSSYEHTVYHLKDVLLLQISSVKRKQKRSANTSDHQTAVVPPSPQEATAVPIPVIQSGLSFSNVSAIISTLNDLSSRADNVLDIVDTTRRLMDLWPRLKGLPRLSNIWPERDKEGEGEEEEEESIAAHVYSIIANIKESFKSGCPLGATQIFITSVKDKEVFESVHTQYSGTIQSVQKDICKYLLTLIPSMSDSNKSLSIIEKFEPISSWFSISSILHKCHLSIFKIYYAELEKIQQIYEKEKGCPPLARGRPPVAGAIEWSRGLLRRVEDPLIVFKGDEMLMKTSECHHVCSLHNRIATALIQYEALLYKGVKERIDKSLVAFMAAPLLRIQTNDQGKTNIIVNADTGLLELLEESKALKQLQIKVPSIAMSILSQEARIKDFKHQLQHQIDLFTTAVAAVDNKLLPVFDSLVQTVMRFYLPGWTTLTWSTLNIDPFLHHLDTATSSLQSIVDISNGILNGRVYPTLRKISHLSLFDADLITSDVWVPSDVSDAIKSQISSRSDEIIHNSSLIKTAIHEIIEIVQQAYAKLQLTLEDHSNAMRKSRDFIHIPKLITTGSTSHKKSSKPLKSKKQSKQDIVEEKELMHSSVNEAVIDSFFGLINDIIGQLVSRSVSKFHKLICQRPVELKEETTDECSVRLRVDMMFNIPKYVLVPDIQTVYNVVNDVLTSIAGVLNLCGPSNDESYDINIEEIVDKIHSIKTSMSEYFEGLDPLVVEYIESLKMFDHLWQDDINASLTAFQEEYPTQTEWKEKVMYYVNIEKQISCLPTSLTIGPILLITFPMRATLQSISSNWKSKFASHLHRLAKTALDTLVDQQKKMMELLTTPVAVEDLPFLKEVLELLEHIDELQHSIDEHYIPVEDMYNQLNEFNLTLERTEFEDIKSLRQKWNELTLKANEVHSYLLIDQRMVYAQETVRQVKEFVVQTIQFRNAFDTEGPLAPGLTPNQAVVRVGYFMNQCKALQIKRELLDTIQKLMNIPLTVYHELKQTQEELSYLSALYSNYQSFISFDESFRSTLWSVVDIDSAMNEVEGFWSGFFSLPPEQQEWEASRKLSQEIMNYRQTLPLLRKLHNKEIRNRHWIQIMNISNFNFPLETKLLKLNHLLEANLLRYTGEIKGIIENAQKEQEMEYQFLAIEEEWLEQVFHFDTQELPLLSPSHSMLLLESLDSTQTQLTVMLMSKHIDPLRNEAAQWVGKLGTVAEVLQLWLSVQELWLSLEPVYNDKFSSEEYADDNLEELHDFCEITETWVSLMNKTLALKNCIQCCITCDEPILPILQKLKCDLEKCKESLATYLIEKRNAFPRLYFIPNDGLLTLLSNSMSINHIKPYLGSLFGNIASLTADSNNPLSIATVTSAEGEKLQLTQEVRMTNNIEDWLTNLLKSTHVSIRELLLRSMDNDMPSLEELIVYQLTQVACISMHHQWTKDNELALVSCRYDRRALPGLRAKFNNLVVMKLSVLLTRMTWKQSNEPITHLHRIRMETLTVLSMWLRDMSDDLCQRKIRDATDFEWTRLPRMMLHVSGDGVQEFKLHSLNVEFPYYNEFLGCQKIPVFSMRTNNYFISLSQTLNNHLGSCLLLPSQANKTELIKGIGYLIGQYVPVLYCSPVTNKTAVINFITGTAQDGSWACLCDVHSLTSDCLSLFAAMVTELSRALKNKDTVVSITRHNQVTIKPSMAIFITQDIRCSLPPHLSPIFRSFSFLPPDPHAVLRSQCITLGLKGSKSLTYRLNSILTLTSDQLSTSSNILHKPTYNIIRMCQALKVAANRARTTTTATPTALASYYNTTPSHTTEGLSDMVKIIGPISPYTANKGVGRYGRVNKTQVTTTQASVPLNSAAIKEHTLVAETLAVMLGSQYTNEELPVFQSILEEAFKDCPDIGLRIISPDINRNLSSFLQSSSCFKSQLSLLEEQAKRNGLSPTGPWLAKTEQLFLLSKTNHAIVIAGRENSGKSSSLKTVISALNSKDGDTEMKAVRLQKIYPSVFMDQSDIFGQMDDNGSWRDGIFTTLIKKSIKATQTTIWVSFDGPMDEQLFDYIGEIVSSKCMSLGNGENILVNTNTVKLVFETGLLSKASPANLTNCSIVYFDSNVLTWRSLAHVWLKTRKANESTVLLKLFECTIDTVSQFVLQKLDYQDKENEVTLFQNCLSYLSSLLDAYTDAAELFSEQHVEKLFLFSLIWSFGSILTSDKEREKFSQFLRQFTNCLPDDDTDYSVFEYYVDESGEWDVWQNKLPEERCQGVDLMGRVFVETPITICSEVLLDLTLSAKRHVLLTGPHSSGKTSILNHYLSSRGLQFTKTESVKRITCNGFTQSEHLHNFMKVNLQHKQGFTYGPADNRLMHLMLDDLHLPHKHSNSSYEYMRQFIDDHGVYNLTKTNQNVKIEDILLFGSYSCNDEVCTIDSRLKRHFMIIPINDLSDNNLKDIIPLTLKNLTTLSSASVLPSVIESLVNASIDLYFKIKSTFKKSNSPGRCHYFFSLNNLEVALQGLGFWPEAKNQSDFAILWMSEMTRAFGSSLCRQEDKQWLTDAILSTATQHFKQVTLREETIFSSISPETDTVKENNSLNVMPKITLYLIDEWQWLSLAFCQHIVRHNEEANPSTEPIDLILRDDQLKFVESIHRSLKHPRGNCIVIGSLGQPVFKLCQLSLFIAGYTIHTIKDDNIQIYDVMKSMLQLAGLEGKQVALLLQEHQLRSHVVLNALSGFLSSGDVPTLFTMEEMTSLMNAVVPSMKRDFPSEQIEPEQYLRARICHNLRLVLCITPDSPLLNEYAHCYQGMLQESQVIWMDEWNMDAFNAVVTWNLWDDPRSVNIPIDTRSQAIECMSSIHYDMLSDNKSMIQAGVVSLPKPQSIGVSLIESSDRTSSFYYMLEKMSYLLEQGGKLDLPYIGALSLMNLMECLFGLYEEKYNKMNTESHDLKRALDTLQNMKESVKEMQSKLDVMKQELAVTSQQSSDLMKQVTDKSCQLERTKAVLEQSGPVFSAMKMVTEQRKLLSENDEDDKELLAVFFERLSSKTSRIEILMERTTQQLKKAEIIESETRKALLTAKEQALYWQNKIDRNTIEQVKSLNNPPVLVGTILELMLRLLQDPSDTFQPPIPPRKSQPTLGGSIDKEYWNQLQLAIGDSQRFLDMINRLKWEGGLSSKLVHLVETKLATSRNVPPQSPSTTSSDSSYGGGLITVSLAKHASESAAVMCAFAVAIVEYQYSFQPHREAVKKLEKLKKDMENLQNENSLQLQSSFDEISTDCDEDKDLETISEEDQKRIESELEELRNQFDLSVMEKNNLQKTCQMLVTKLKLAKNLLDNLHLRINEWKQRLSQLPSTDVLLNDCLIAAAFLTYCGSLKPRSLQIVLHKLGNKYIPHSFGDVIDMESLAVFLMTLPCYHHLSLEGLPLDKHSTLMASIIDSSHVYQWPLVIDPLGVACQWLEKHFKSNKLLVLEYNDPSLNSSLSSCVADGCTLIITNVDLSHLASNDNNNINAIIDCKKSILKKKTPFKLTIDGKEIECSHNFKLVLVTGSSLVDVPKSVASKFSVIFMRPETKGLEYNFMQEFIEIQNSKMSNDIQHIKKEVYAAIVKVETLDKQLLLAISNDGKEIDIEHKTVNKLLSVNKSLEFANESLLQLRERYSDMTTSHMTILKSLANRAAIITNTACLMGHIRPIYYTSLEYALKVFKNYIKQSGSRVQGEDSLSKLTKFGYSHFDKGYMELDRQIFSILLALSIEENNKKASVAEIEFLISPTPGSRYVTKGLIQQPNDGGSIASSTVHFGKKSYDWMTEDQWQRLLTIASNFDWIHPILNSFGRDGKEMIWRSVSEGNAPETISLIDTIGHKLTLLQQYIIQCALRPERFTQFGLVFSAHVLEYKPLSSSYFDLQSAMKSSCDLFPLLMYNDDPNIPLLRLQHLASKNQVSLRVVDMFGIQEDEDISDIVKYIHEVMANEDQWILFHQLTYTCENKLTMSLYKLLTGLVGKNTDRVWLSINIDGIKLRPSILKFCYRISTEEPKLPINSLVHFLNICEHKNVLNNQRNEWLPLLHSISMFHIILSLRQMCCYWSFKQSYKWRYTHIMDALKYVLSEFFSQETGFSGNVGTRPISWSGIRYMISQVIYGSLITDVTDLTTLNALTDHWLHPGGPKRDAGIYHIPSIFFTPSTRLPALIQSVESASPPLIPNALLYGIHFTLEMKLEQKDVILTQLEQLHQLNQGNSPSSELFPSKRQRRQTLHRMSILGMLSSTAKKYSVQSAASTSGQQVSIRSADKLPSFIQIPVNMMSCQLDGLYVQYMVNCDRSLMDGGIYREILAKLMHIVTRLLDTFCIGWKKDVLLEKLRKHNTNIPFTQFITHETLKLNDCILEIINDLQNIQLLLKGSVGDVLLADSHLVKTAMSLVLLKVPQRWYDLFDGTSPPTDQWELKEWLCDVVMRYTFIDKIVAWGHDRMPTYWLGGFFNPQALLSIYQQKFASQGTYEEMIFVAELTTRDKDHIRDPPSEGIFSYGMYFWGIHFEKTTNLELHDTPPKSIRPSPLPVVHLSLRPLSNVFHCPADVKPPYIHYVPCLHTRSSKEPLFYLKISSNDVMSNKWILRNLTCTTRPF